MRFVARQVRGVTPTQVEVLWDKGNGFYSIISQSVCPRAIGDLPDKQRNEIAAMLENSPAMLELLKDIAYPKRGSDSEYWTLSEVADKAQKILSQIEKTIDLLP